jgi:hypothetical protein
MSPREAITMTSEEIDAFLTTRRHVALAFLRSDGAPDVTIVPSRYERGRLLLETELPAGSRVCCCAEVNPSYYEIRGVAVHGSIEPSDDAVTVAPEHVTSFDFSKIRDRPD